MDPRKTLAGYLFASAAVTAAMALAACAGGARAIPDPTAKHLEYAEKNGYPSTLPSLKNGRRLYVNRCSSCHTLHGPASIPAKDWPAIVQDMASNAQINEDQVRDITRYLVAVAGSTQGDTPPSASTAPAAPAAATETAPPSP